MEKYDAEHLRKSIIIVANEVKRICNKNGINYSLDGGSLIGAVRHKGFIPWDDDFDIDLTRKEYERFIKACEKDLGEEFFLQTCETDSYYPKGFCKVLLRGTSVIEPSSINSKYQKGIFVDVFPWDNVPDNIVSKYVQMFVVYVCDKILHQQSGVSLPSNSSLCKKVIFYLLRLAGKIIPRKLLVKIRRKYLLKYPNTTNNVACMVCVAGYRKTEMKRSVFARYIDLPFEDTSFSVVAEYDYMLKKIFGDYMTLPPIEKRKSHHYVEVDFGKY